MAYKHADDHYDSVEAGAIAQTLFRKSMEKIPNCKVSKTKQDKDILGVDFECETPTKKVTFEVTTHIDPEVLGDGEPISKKYLRVTVDSLGNKNIKTIFNTQADCWAFYNPRHAKNIFMVFRVSKLRDFIAQKYGIINDINSASKISAAKRGYVYCRDRPSYGSTDVILYIPIESVKDLYQTLEIPFEAFPQIEVA